MSRRIVLAGTVALAAGLGVAGSLLKAGDRIVFVGDSITAQAVGSAQGFYHQFTNELSRAYPDARHEVVGLGFSGNTLFDWTDGIEVRSRTQAVPANTGGFEVRSAFATRADIVFVLLGMNDLLRPSLRDEEASLLAWKEKYRELVGALRTRVAPRELVLCEIPPLTEDPRSPKNRVRERLTCLTRELAQESGCRVAETGASILEVVARCRKVRQDHHVVPDTVHPQMPLGHTALARGMVAALQDEALVAAFDARIEAEVAKLRPDRPAVTVVFRPQPGCAAEGPEQTYTLCCYWNDPQAGGGGRVPAFSLDVPDGWRVTDGGQAGGEATFVVRGVPDRLQTPLTAVVRAGDETVRATVQVPAPWRVLCGPDNGGAWSAQRAYQPEQSVPFMEADLVAGKGLLAPVTGGGKTYGWQVCTPCVDYTAGDDPDAVVPYSLTFGSENDVLYAARWVFSAQDRPVEVVLSHRTFSATLGFVVWVNGARVLVADLNRGGKNRATGRAELKRGWNRLLVRNDHLQWQRQFACALRPAATNDTLGDLRYAIHPQ